MFVRYLYPTPSPPNCYQADKKKLFSHCLLVHNRSWTKHKDDSLRIVQQHFLQAVQRVSLAVKHHLCQIDVMQVSDVLDGHRPFKQLWTVKRSKQSVTVNSYVTYLEKNLGFSAIFTRYHY